MLSGTSSFSRKKGTGHKLTAIPACHKRRQSPIATRGAQLKSVKIKEKAEPETPIASRFSLGYVDKIDTRSTFTKIAWWQTTPVVCAFTSKQTV